MLKAKKFRTSRNADCLQRRAADGCGGGGEGRARTATQMINMSGVGSTIQNIMDEEMRSCHLLSESALLCADSLQPTVVQRNSGN
jgi:hypothetical protein